MHSMTVDKDDDTLAVVVLDRNISEEIRIMEIGDELTEIASNIPAGKTLVLDLQDVEYCSSAMVCELVQLHKSTEKNGVELKLRHVSPTIQDILRVMRLDAVFRIESSNA
ncbi:MAG: STAS domain-containing protein [Pirellulaceae bacterium]|jgi:anti-anti-sigma factor|nr:STAS domain-containing protein [Pirellulaceae bacterium]HJN11182.1 STAS domain-containing protein [Pirellulaceae bacterium]